jgi:hypothetical protein
MPFDPKKPWPLRDWKEFPVWLVWVRKTNPEGGLENVDLRLIAKSKTLAEIERDAIVKAERDATGVWIEERMGNQVYPQRDIRLAFRMLHASNKWERDLPREKK